MKLLKQLARGSLSLLGYSVSRKETGWELVRPSSLLPLAIWPTESDVRGAREAIARHCDADPGFGWWSDRKALEAYLSPERMAQQLEVLELCRRRGVDLSGRVAEIGAGTGFLLRAIADRFHAAALTAFEPSPGGCALARRMCPQATVHPTGLTGVEHEAAYDLVLCIEVLEHLVDPIGALRRMLAMVATGGALVLAVPDGRCDSMGPATLNDDGSSYQGHINFWSPESWRHLLLRTSRGFSVETGALPPRNLYAVVRRGTTGPPRDADPVHGGR